MKKRIKLGVEMGSREEAQEERDIYIYRLIHVVVWQKPTQNCTAIFHQLKNT